MSKTIWKFPFPIADSFSMSVPKGAQIVSVQIQRSEPCFWAVVDPDADAEPWFFHVYGTGHPIEDIGEFLGTFQMAEGRLAFHLFGQALGAAPHD